MYTFVKLRQAILLKIDALFLHANSTSIKSFLKKEEIAIVSHKHCPTIFL